MSHQMDDPSENPSRVDNRAYNQTGGGSTKQDRGTGSIYLLRISEKTADRRNEGKVTIETLPEEILLEMFAFYMCKVSRNDEWRTLVHVCRSWRSIVFAAPRRLNLQLVCTSKTPTRQMLDIWPALPINVLLSGRCAEINDNVLAALEDRDRICAVRIHHVYNDEIQKLARAMQVTFPALTDLDVETFFNTGSFPESLLGGSAPNLRSLRLANIAFSTLPKLLLSYPYLVKFSVSENYYHESTYVSSDVMVDCLPSLTRLEHLRIEFQPFSDGVSRRPPPLTRTVFPVLGTLILKGITKYLDQLLAHIEAPRLNYVNIKFVGPPDFGISRIARCICHTEPFEAFDETYMYFCNVFFNVVLSSRKGTLGGKMLTLSIRWEDSGWKLLELTQDSCNPFFEPSNPWAFQAAYLPSWARDLGNAPWLHLLRFFTTTEYLYLTQGFAKCVAPALQELTGAGVTDVLPILRNIFIKRLDSLGPVRQALGKFVASRQLYSGHAIDVQCWVVDEDIDGSRRR
jgi:hypothetical protein